MDVPLDEPDAARAAARARDTQLVHAVRAGDPNAFGQLYDAWFDRVYDLVSRIVRDDEVAAEVAQDTFLNAWRSLDRLENPDAFGGWLLRIARNGAYNRSQKEGRSTAFDDQGLAMIESVGASPTSAPAGFGVEDRLSRAATPEAALEDKEAVSLVWQAADALPDRDREVLDLQLRHGLSPAEIGDVLGMNRNAANQLVHRLRGRLETAIRARVLWRGGEPTCAVLGDRLRGAGITAFGPEAVRVVERHVPGCSECDERQRTRLQPAALFGAAPILIAPQLIKQSSAAALEAAGVPMQGSAFSSAALGNAASSVTTSAGNVAGQPATPGSAPGEAPASPPGAPGSPTMAAPADVQPITAAARSATRTRGGARIAMLSAAAVVIVVAAIVGLALRMQNGDSSAQLTATGTAAPTTTAATTAKTAAPPRRTGETSDSSTAPTAVTPTDPQTPTSTAPQPTVTTAPTTPPTTAGTTTTTTPPTVTATFDLKPNATYPNWSMEQGSSANQPPALTWAVTVAPATTTFTVGVEGPDGASPKTLLSSDRKGTFVVCPGQRTVVNGSTYCYATPGSYTYTLTVYGPTGQPLTTKSAVLTVMPQIIN